MNKKKILFADNDPDFLKVRKRFLEEEGYEVIPATDPTEARRILEAGGINLAIIDIRLTDDGDDKDQSGLTVAKETAPSIPKIILTGFPSVEGVREALTLRPGGLPAAVDFIAKGEGPEELLKAVKKGLGYEVTRFLETINGTSEQLRQDYEEAREQAKWNFRVTLRVSVTGVILIFIGIAVLLAGIAVGVGEVLATGVLAEAAGIVVEVVSLLFFKRVDAANSRMDQYHRELLQTKRFENLLVACDELASLTKQDSCRETIITSTLDKWLGSASDTSASAQ